MTSLIFLLPSVAKQCICEAYDIDIENVGDRNKYGVKTTLEVSCAYKPVSE